MNIEQKSREVAMLVTRSTEDAALVQPTLAAALQSAVAEEREECAKLMEYNAGRTARWLAAAIRARGQKETA